MGIKISDIPAEGLTLQLDQKLSLFEKVPAVTACTATLRIIPQTEGTVEVTGRVQTSPLLECSRCLKKYVHAVDVEIHVELVRGSLEDSKAEQELTSEELDQEFYEHDEIEPLDFVREQVLLALPMVPLHHPDCKGLCSMCGIDLNDAECECKKNEEPSGPFSELKKLFSQEKE
ncbi:MAG: DUF177 domain-containing protein [Nitrospirota bacterium]